MLIAISVGQALIESCSDELRKRRPLRVIAPLNYEYKKLRLYLVYLSKVHV